MLRDVILKASHMLTSPLSQDDRFSLSYIRQPGEEAHVISEAIGRFGHPLTPRASINGWYLMVGVLGGAALSLFLNIYRSLILLPSFGPTPLIDVFNLMLICSVPCLAVCVLMMLSLRREAYLQRSARASRILPDATVMVSVSPEGIAWERPGATTTLAWTMISAIEERHGRIEFDSEATVHYIPAHAFHNRQEQDAVLARIRNLWQPPAPAKP
ncbi:MULTISPECIES: YcxB family protein [Rhizobium]|uniref:YcxB family protein n=1 Tax=Rhizobium rhododendri TaxID=2506430 RepID=A0ABY8IET8_9HYPH|nr:MULTISPECIES: YcxB family protein [Rhizobium]MBZ5762971.1 YcxB family protein [Rhizobium sp. VS19-DR96]MBZ5768843.1 YcxB family protein [Rhizobium sp. VS19-DR129.2]MBZ5776471.1 YcxB family protein [Rhizobium sp. VS19-DRK62.2]MBZ5787627.1 YcxB family protein [Rhizobium sp. VS19-DR121]MBZ5805200.1 YcxB family protein [Rhizobium sp. VS19-DR181]